LAATREALGEQASRRPAGELWQPRCFDCALRTPKQYHEKVEYIHLNRVRAGWVGRPQDWRWSSFNEYAGMRPEEQRQRGALTIDRVRIPADPRTQL
jgi:hypothetical protein